MEIRFGDTKYFTLLKLQKELKYFEYERLDLIAYDKLRNEVDMKIAQIHHADKVEREKRASGQTGT